MGLLQRLGLPEQRPAEEEKHATAESASPPAGGGVHEHPAPKEQASEELDANELARAGAPTQEWNVIEDAPWPEDLPSEEPSAAPDPPEAVKPAPNPPEAIEPSPPPRPSVSIPPPAAQSNAAAAEPNGPFGAELSAPNGSSSRPREAAAIKTSEPAVAKAKVIAFANQKGGVAKTTTTLNLAVAFAEAGHRVLAVDMDPQANLTMSQGIDPDSVEKSMYDVLVNKIPIREVIRKREIDVACASIDLAGAEIAMSTQIGRERSLVKGLKPVLEDYDFICIDTPPSLGLLTINALTAAAKVIVPVQCEYLSMRGLIQLQNTLSMIRQELNPDVEIEGILPTLVDSRTVHAKEAIEILEENFGDRVFATRIKKTIRFAEAPVKGTSVLKYDPEGVAAKSYRDLAKEVLANGKR
jgi:chromosome partitioning protein